MRRWAYVRLRRTRTAKAATARRTPRAGLLVEETVIIPASTTLVATLVILSVPALAATLTVDLKGGADHTDIQAAIDDAANGDTVLVKPGAYIVSSSIDFNRRYDPDDPASPPYKNLELRAEAGPTATRISMASSAPDTEGASVVVFRNRETAASIVSGFTLEGGNTTAVYMGGGISFWPGTRAKVENCVITGNVAREGGGIYVYEAYPTVRNCTIAGNVAEEGGGGIYVTMGRPTLTNCIVWGNAGGGAGWGTGVNMYSYYSCIEGPAEVPGLGMIRADPRFCGFAGPSLVYVDSGYADPGDGSARHPLRELDSALTGFSLALAADSPCIGTGEGGANLGADAGVEDCAGAAPRTVVVAAGTYALKGAFLTPHVSIVGTGADDTVLLGTVFGLRTGCVIEDVTITHGVQGGIVVSANETPALTRCALVENRAKLGGGGLRLFGSATVTRCRIAANIALYGGGVACSGDASAPILRECVIAGNWAKSGGGGLSSGARSSPTLINCILSGNCVVSGATGVSTVLTNLKLVNCTIADNWASSDYPEPLQLGLESPSPRLVNTIVARLRPRPADPGTPLNCVAQYPCFVACVLRRDPVFVRAGVNDFTRFKTVDIDGHTYSFPDFELIAPDYRLLPGSPCIDVGVAEEAPETDFAGNARPAWGAVDAGAYEYTGDEAPAPLPQFVRGNANDDGTVNIADAVFVFQYLFKYGPPPVCMKAADANDSGTLDIADGITILMALFGDRRLLPAPRDYCGLDPTPDSLACTHCGACREIDP